MYICLASQTDVNQTVHTSLTTKRNVVKIIGCKGKYWNEEVAETS